MNIKKYFNLKIIVGLIAVIIGYILMRFIEINTLTGYPPQDLYKNPSLSEPAWLKFSAVSLIILGLIILIWGRLEKTIERMGKNTKILNIVAITVLAIFIVSFSFWAIIGFFPEEEIDGVYPSMPLIIPDETANSQIYRNEEYGLETSNLKESKYYREFNRVSEDIDFSLFRESWNALKKEYANPEDMDAQKMMYGAISGMVKSLGNPYTVFFNPEDTKKFLEDINGKFEGVGMELGIRNEQLTVIAPLENTPADKAGLRPGDKIIEIDDTASSDISIEEAVTLIRGEKGTEVVLTIFRESWDETKEFKIQRAVINIPSSKWELLATDGEKSEQGEMAHIKIYYFSKNLDIDFTKMADEILNSPAEKIILDLRNNPGGYLVRAQDIAGWFLERDKVVVIEDFGPDEEQKINKTQGNSKFLEYPMVILSNQGSASASEILASALRDNRGIKIIGETSFGKGSVQKLEKLSDGSSLKITIAKWLTPNEESIFGIGLDPDIEIKMTEDDYTNKNDPQLDKAIEVLNKMK